MLVFPDVRREHDRLRGQQLIFSQPDLLLSREGPEADPFAPAKLLEYAKQKRHLLDGRGIAGAHFLVEPVAAPL